ncbi:LuxR C-terminal-related transcriptional regulator [Nocardioides sp. MAHUQ-72]|uniref:LuxR C-terminal-related transcriptional regulator n=1 Tax=unclassified Nocardioides TaxID=2615069 RepID=UPI003621BA3D
MPTPLLETKLFLPRPRPGLVPRPRLLGRLQQGLASRLMLVSAPAGFGKTTLLVDWVASVPAVAGRETSAAWLSLDPGDNDPATFWTYVIAALRTVEPDVGADALGLLEGPRPPAARHVLTALLNDLGTAGADVVLVLDDYHVIDSAEVHEGVQFLLEHLPHRLHLVIASRTDPALPLPRLRARGDLVEVRAADLRFTPDEAATYLNDAMGLRLTSYDVDALEERTEGWIAALQLAALSMAGRDDVASFIAGFAGDDRYVVDYLVEEVLQRLPEEVRSFLLQTSVLDRMTGSLCDAVTGRDGGRGVLEALDRDNLFLVPLDDRRRWYRYHHLFADVLRARLLDEHPERVDALHRLAGDWFERHGDRTEAIRHAMAGHDFEGAATLVELEIPAMRRDRREATMRGWLEALPDDVLRARPVLCNSLGGARMSTGSFEGVEELLDDAERWLTEDEAGTLPGAVVVDRDELRRLPAAIAVHRAGLALARGDVDGTVGHARRALEAALEDDHLARGAASALIGLAAWSTGDLAVAHDSYAVSLGELEAAGHVSDVLGCTIALADIQLARGRLRAALRTYQQGLELASPTEGRVLRGTADMHVGLAALHRELGDLAAARRELTRSRELGEQAALPQNAYRWRVVMAQVCEAEGDPEAATALLDEAERVYVGDFSPEVRPVPALRARLWARQERVDDARAWVERRGLSVTDDLGYLRELEHLTLARVLVAEHTPTSGGTGLDQALDLLARLLRAAQDGDRNGSVIEIRVVQALAHQRRGDLARATASLEAALALAGPEGYARTFLDEGEPMAGLLAAAADRGVAAAYVGRLRAALGAAPDVAPDRAAPAPGLVEPLSSREREVLRLLGTDLNGPEIARELVVSLNTVRTHTRNVYQKLGVNNRRAALRRARELDLL